MLCQYTNCHEETNLPILVINKDRERGLRSRRFCSQEHAILGMLEWLSMVKRGGPTFREIIAQLKEEFSWTPVDIGELK